MGTEKRQQASGLLGVPPTAFLPGPRASRSIRNRRVPSAGELPDVRRIARSWAAPGHSHWTLRWLRHIFDLLAGKVVELGVVDSISHETVHRTPRRTRSSPGKR